MICIIIISLSNTPLVTSTSSATPTMLATEIYMRVYRASKQRCSYIIIRAVITHRIYLSKTLQVRLGGEGVGFQIREGGLW